MKLKPLLVLCAVITIIIGVYVVVFGMGAPSPIQQACSQEAKICPDGSAVGRIGPNCEFAACPSAEPTSTTLETTMGQTVAGLNVSLTPLEILSDSRCPVDVQCVWAGTVTLKVRIEIEGGMGMGTSEMTLELGKSVTTEPEEITLTKVEPAKTSGTEIFLSSYKFTFEIKKR